MDNHEEDFLELPKPLMQYIGETDDENNLSIVFADEMCACGDGNFIFEARLMSLIDPYLTKDNEEGQANDVDSDLCFGQGRYIVVFSAISKSVIWICHSIALTGGDIYYLYGITLQTRQADDMTVLVACAKGHHTLMLGRAVPAFPAHIDEHFEFPSHRLKFDLPFEYKGLPFERHVLILDKYIACTESWMMAEDNSNDHVSFFDLPDRSCTVSFYNYCLREDTLT
jgi:hypothetical protein